MDNMEMQTNDRWRNKSPTPLTSVLKDVQLQMKQVVDFQHGFQIELKKLTKTVLEMQPMRAITGSNNSDTAGITHCETQESYPKNTCISQELYRLQLEAVRMEQESARLREHVRMQGSLRNSGLAVNSLKDASTCEPPPVPDMHVPDEPSDDPDYMDGRRQFSGSYHDPDYAGGRRQFSGSYHEGASFLAVDSEVPNGTGTANPTGFKKDDEKNAKKQQVFADKEAMLDRVMAALAKPEYNVANFYHSKGCCQRVARNAIFDNLTMAIIFLNSIWMAIDMDYNKACSLATADPIFQAGEHFFCAYFFVEWSVRFGAFRQKRDIFRDYWMVFDGFLATMAVFDTWIVTLVTKLTQADNSCGEGSGAGIISIFKMVRLCRTARMVRLLRRMPELMIMIKGIIAAGRSVFFTLVLLFVIIYVFSLIFRQLTAGSSVGEVYFSGVTHSMTSLLMYGTLPDQADIMINLGDQHFALGILAFFFVLLSGLTVLNMLVGVLVDVVGVVAAVEKEEIAASFIGECVSTALLTARTEENEVSGAGRTSSEIKASIYEGGVEKYEFEVLLTIPHVVKTMQSMGVDVVALADLTDYLFKESDGGMAFAELLKLVMQLRGANTTTVKDIIDLRKFILQEINVMTQCVDELKIEIRGRSPKRAVYQKPQRADDKARWAAFMGPSSNDKVLKAKKSLGPELMDVVTDPPRRTNASLGGDVYPPGHIDDSARQLS